ncbi:MAG: hypothetical protein HOO96_10960 [Polyangiaceae bacterium]|jgi:isopenicillin N synthase-like dioxygenase|nr:hypothetical protein [Polyangiaceae bacterium]
MGLLPKFVTTDDVRAQKTRLDAVVRSIDATAKTCATMPPDVRLAWEGFSKAWRGYCDAEDSWLSAAAEYDEGVAYEKQIADWQVRIGEVCKLAAPPIKPASPGLPEVPEKWHGTVRIVAAAGIALAAVVALRTVAR